MSSLGDCSEGKVLNNQIQTPYSMGISISIIVLCCMRLLLAIRSIYNRLSVIGYLHDNVGGDVKDWKHLHKYKTSSGGAASSLASRSFSAGTVGSSSSSDDGNLLGKAMALLAEGKLDRSISDSNKQKEKRN